MLILEGVNNTNMKCGTKTKCLQFGLQQEVCDGRRIYPPSINIKCIFCPKETFSKNDDSQSCLPCRLCLNLIKKEPCLPNQNRDCGDGCIFGYYWSYNTLLCEKCNWCFFSYNSSVHIMNECKNFSFIIAHKLKPYLATM